MISLLIVAGVSFIGSLYSFINAFKMFGDAAKLANTEYGAEAAKSLNQSGMTLLVAALIYLAVGIAFVVIYRKLNDHEGRLSRLARRNVNLEGKIKSNEQAQEMIKQAVLKPQAVKTVDTSKTLANQETVSYSLESVKFSDIKEGGLIIIGGTNKAMVLELFGDGTARIAWEDGTEDKINLKELAEKGMIDKQ